MVETFCPGIGMYSRISQLRYIILLAFIFVFAPPKVLAADIVINEFLPNPSGSSSEDTEWIELYNTTSSSIDLSNWQLDDTLSGGAPAYTIPLGTTITGNGFSVFEKSTTNIGLNNLDDSVRLINNSGTEVDIYSYYSTTEDFSFGRTQDGSGTWVGFSAPTKGLSNNNGVQVTPTPSPTPTLTPTPTPFSTPSLTPTATVSPTLTPKPAFTPVKTSTPLPSPTISLFSTHQPLPSSSPAQFDQQIVLGMQNQLVPSPTPVDEAKPLNFSAGFNKGLIGPIIFIVLGIGFIFGSAIAFVKKLRTPSFDQEQQIL